MPLYTGAINFFKMVQFYFLAHLVFRYRILQR